MHVYLFLDQEFEEIMSYPEMVKINQQLDEIKITDLDSHITAELDKTQMATLLKPGS